MIDCKDLCDRNITRVYSPGADGGNREEVTSKISNGMV